MHTGVKDLIEISRKFGSDKAYVIAGGGNTSYKNEEHLWIKASGVNLGNIDESGFCVMNRKRLAELSTNSFSADPNTREEEVKNALLNSRVNPEAGLRPSVETSLHDLFTASFVVHTHPTLVNSLMCSQEAGEKTKEIFGDEALYVPYTDPGYILFKKVEEEIVAYKNTQGKEPAIVFLQNHGVFVAADTIAKIEALYNEINNRIIGALPAPPETTAENVGNQMTEILPAVRMLLSGETLKTARALNSNWVNQFIQSKKNFQNAIARPFNPDQMVYCRSEYLYVEHFNTPEETIEQIRTAIADYKNRKGMMPKVIFLENEGVIVADDTAEAVNYLVDMVNDFCQIAALSTHFGGPHPLTKEQAAFIENWEVENYRKKVSLGRGDAGRLVNKIAIVTGAAQGFGAGIAEFLFKEGANVVIADLNQEKGIEFTNKLNESQSKNRAHFVSVNVSDSDSVETLIKETVLNFGGLDVLISNAGILRAGGLDEMDQATFELMTKVNYTGYFLCAKHAQKVMKLQSQVNPDFYMDIIQINSKSGLKGSNKNFAYAGGKFGGIGLTQSFALELMPFNIKVNSICPGNFFDGPLWSDPENGLFVQYLNAGKVPGAKTIEDVKSFYEAQVPAKRGCKAEDVAKAILYVIDQEYETGQAVPVTGGQNMLN